MKSKKIILFNFVILILFAISGCQEDEKPEESGEFIEIDFLKFSDFGCENSQLNLKSEFTENHYVITSNSELEYYLRMDCIPQIDFSEYFLIIGVKRFTTGASILDEKAEENNTEIVYTVTFQTDATFFPTPLKYHAIINSSSSLKNIRIEEIVIDYVK